jgi:hypothetical protein
MTEKELNSEVEAAKVTHKLSKKIIGTEEPLEPLP